MIVLSGEMRAAVDNALDDGCPVISTSVDADGRPSLSFYGSTQVHADDQLAIWVRNPAGRFLRRIAANPHVAFLYRNPEQRQLWQFQGRARVVEDPGTRDAIYERSNKLERDRDPDRIGVAVVIDLDRVLERGQLVMER